MKARITLASLCLLGLLGLLGTASTAQATPTINLTNNNGISVATSYWPSTSPLLYDITLNSALLPQQAGVRVLLPNDYFTNTTKTYPVLYLLHGGGGVYTDWTTYGNVESVVAGKEVIVVMPDGGKGSWYANFDNFGAGGPPQWQTFEINQLIPWIDTNFRTINNRNGRAIAGLSMGGYGAMSYAALHPDTFLSASAFSGAVDTGLPAFDAYLEVSPVIENLAPGAIFGVPPLDESGIQANDPTALAANLGGMHLAEYTGNGQQGPLDGAFAITGVFDNIQEAVVEQMNIQFDSALTASGIAHTFVDYGNGTHSWPYWNRDFQQEFPSIMAAFANPQAPANVVADSGFETQGMGPWVCSGQCGTDYNKGNAQSGVGNGWARNILGWNDIDQTVQVAPNTNYVLTGWLRTSSNNSNGYFGVRTTGGTVIGQTQFASFGSYTKVTVNLNTGNNSNVVVFGGTWAVGDTWVQLDNISLAPSISSSVY